MTSREQSRGALTLRKLASELAARGIKTVVRAAWTFVHAEGLSFTKTHPATEQDRPDIARRRICWKAHQGRIDASRLVFIDETWIKANMVPLRGWGPSGQRLEASAPFGHRKTMTFIAALRYDCVRRDVGHRRPINGELFTLYVERVLAPTLSVILDNLGSQKGKLYSATIWLGSRIAPPEMFLNAGPLPHVICSPVGMGPRGR